MLSSRDQAAIVEEMVTWMAAGLTVGNVDGSRVVVHGYYNAESLSVTLVVEERTKRRSSSRRPFPSRTVARATVSTDAAFRGEQSRAALDYTLRVIKQHTPTLMLPDGAMNIELIEPVAPILPPTEEDWEEARLVVERALARRDQRPSRRRGDASGTRGRTTGSS